MTSSSGGVRSPIHTGRGLAASVLSHDVIHDTGDHKPTPRSHLRGRRGWKTTDMSGNLPNTHAYTSSTAVGLARVCVGGCLMLHLVKGSLSSFPAQTFHNSVHLVR